MSLTKENIVNQGWIFNNGAFVRRHFLLKFNNPEILIIRKEGDYPTIFAGNINNEQEFIDLMIKLKL